MARARHGAILINGDLFYREAPCPIGSQSLCGSSPAPVGGEQTYLAPSWAWVDARFGYAIARPGEEPGQWRLEMREPDGTAFARCGLANRELYCRDLPR